ncbi:hypothetical protein IKF81_02295 [Candidatus Saccharibacteria bacterium]|nr:hypothetical protein [Candidatus Saccharibacteria bacterium]
MSKTNKAIAALSIAASLGMAAAPMATFAATNTPNAQRDILNVTIEEVCAFGYGNITAGSHTDGTTTGYTGENTTARPADTEATPPVAAAGAGNGLWNTSSVVGYDNNAQTVQEDTDTAYGIMEANTVNPNFASTTLNVVCNDADGYTITAQTTDLTNSNVANGIVSTAAAPAAGTSSWAFQIVDATDSGSGGTNTGVIQTSAGASGWYGGYSSATPIISAPTTGTDKSTPDTGDSWTMTYGVGISKAQAAATYEGHVDYILASIDS